MIRLIDLKTDYRKKPLLTESAVPSFSFAYEGDNFTQTFYRIRVSSAEEKLLKGEGDMWDSGNVASDRTCGIVYGGKSLESRREYFWNVTTDAGTSSAETFETGLLRDEDFFAEYISAPLTRVGGALFFRKDVRIKEGAAVRKARIYVVGIGCHEFYVNGEKVSEGYLNPPVSDYNKTVFYSAYRFEDKLKEGNNSLGVMVGHGWLGARKLLAQIYITYENGEEEVFGTAPCLGWWVRGSFITEDSIYDGEICDGRLKDEFSAWCDPQTEPDWSEGWLYGLLCERPSGKPTPQTLQPITEAGRFSPVSLNPIGRNRTVYDLGQVFSGFASVKVKGGRGAKITLKYGEQLSEDGSVNQLNLRTALARDVYILSGNGVEEYTPRFTYHGFRYVEAETEGDAEILSLEGVYIRNAVARTGEFLCDDEILNTLHRNAVMTEGSNLHGVMTDCPQRDERFGWLNDLSSRIRQSVLNYDLSAFLPKVVRDITDTQDGEGRIADTAPFFTGFRPADPVSVCYLTFGLTAYRYYGNDGLLKEQFPRYKRWVDYLTSVCRDDGATVYMRYADWCPPERFDGDEDPASKQTPGDFVSACYYYLHLKTISEIAGIIGEEKEKKEYSSLADKAEKAILKKYFDPERNSFSSGSQATYALGARIFGSSVPDAGGMAEAFARSVINSGYHFVLGNQSYVHAFDLLGEYGYADTVIKALVNPEYPGWGYMVANDATTVWERWEKTMRQKMHSFCHPMFASFDGWFYNALAGIRCSGDACGFDKIEICPVKTRLLGKIRASLTTVRGKISVEITEREDGNTILSASFPPNTHAEIRLENIVSVTGDHADTGTDKVTVTGGGSVTVCYRKETR